VETPRLFQQPVPVLQVRCGLHHALALTSAGTVLAWGHGARGRLGLGDEANVQDPTLVPGLPPVRRRRSLDAAARAC
jgi:alpha-tubulin suppressor-like RCC1 family protein